MKDEAQQAYELPQGALDGLVEVPFPAPVAYTPQTVGAWLLIALVLATLAWLVWRRFQRWRRDAYRRQALAELSGIAATGRAGELPLLVRRVALTAYARREVASLTGEAWAVFLKESAPRADINDDFGRALERLAYEPHVARDDHDHEQVLATARRWIEGHHARL